MLFRSIGIRHVQFQTRELENPNYQANGPDRCYHCKSTLYQAIFEWANSEGFETIVSGTNADDLGDYRPGLKAATDHGVRAPLAELGLGKQHVRGIAHAWGLSVANKPASPCLASRIAYGQVVTLGRLQQIEGMEVWMHSQGFHDVRARLHADRLLRLEIAPEHLGMACESSMRARILGKAKELGFQYVTIDLNGRESGSMNRVLGDAKAQSIESGR